MTVIAFPGLPERPPGDPKRGSLLDTLGRNFWHAVKAWNNDPSPEALERTVGAATFYSSRRKRPRRGDGQGHRLYT